MTLDVRITGRGQPTPGLIPLATGAALARQAVVDARKAEGEGRPGEAVRSYGVALGLTASAWESPLLAPTRAAAAAGLARLVPAHPAAESLRQQALAWLERAPADDLDGSDLADHALLLDAANPLRPRLLEQAAAAPRPLAAVAARAAEIAGDPSTRLRLARSAVREAPEVASHHLLVAGLDGRRDKDRSADYIVAAGLFLGAGERQQAQQAADLARRLEPANRLATVMLADLLRLAGQAEEAIDLLDPLPAEAPGPGLAAIAIRALARALELDGRRKDALEQIAKVLDLEDAPSEDFVFAADVRSMQGDFAAARDALDRALRVDPDELAVIYASVRYWLRAKRPDEAVGDVEHALRRRPVNPYLHVLLGFVDTAASRGPGLDEQIERAAEFGLDASEAWSWASSLSEDQGDLRSAANALDKALKLSPKDPGLLARQGGILLALGQYDDAVHVLRRCIRRTKSDVDSFRRLAEALTASGRPEKALTVLDQAITTLPGNGSLLGARGLVHRRLGDLAAAERDLCGSLQCEPDPSWAAELFGVLCRRMDEPTAAAKVADYMDGRTGDLAATMWNAGDVTGALAVARVGLARGSAERNRAGQARLYIIRGFGEWRTGVGAGPESDLRRAVDLCPDDGHGHVFLGAYLVQQDRYEEASAEVALARVLDPGSVTVAQVATDVLRQVKGDTAALTELDEAIRQIGEDPRLLTRRAVLLAEVGRAEEALALVTDLRGQGVGDPRLQITEGAALNALGRYPEAIAILDAALQTDRGNVEVRLNLADSLNHVGEPVKAAEVLAEIAESAFNSRILMVRGQIRHSLHDKGCLEDFRSALERNAWRSEARVELIDAAVEFGENRLARQNFRQLLADGGLDDDPRVVRLAWLLGERDLALKRIKGILASAEARKPSMNQAACAARVYESAIRLERGEVGLAIASGRAAVQLDDAYPDARFVLSAALKAAGSLDEALAVLGSADNPLLTPQRVQLLLDSGRRDEALRLVRGVLRARPGDDRLTTDLVNALTGHGLLLQAARILRACLGAEPSPWILWSAGVLLSAMGDFPRAIRILELARRRSSMLPDVDVRLAWAYSNLTTARPSRVLTAANRALKRQPDDFYTLRTKADALLELNREPQARRLYKRIIEKLSSSPTFPYGGSLAGWCSYRLGEYERALDNMLRAVSASTGPTAADRFDLALILFVAGRPSRAKRELAQAIEACRTLPSPLQRHGILQVAMVDLDDAVALGPPGLNLTVGEQLQAMLRRQLKATESAFGPVQPFLAAVDGVPGISRRQ